MVGVGDFCGIAEVCIPTTGTKRLQSKRVYGMI